MMGLFDEEERPRFPKIVADTVREDEEKALWKQVVEKGDFEDEIKEKEEEELGLDSPISKSGDETRLEDLL